MFFGLVLVMYFKCQDVKDNLGLENRKKIYFGEGNFFLNVEYVFFLQGFSIFVIIFVF